MKIALVYVPVPKFPLSDAERRYSNAFFQRCARTYFQHLTTEDFKHFWEIEKINQGLLYIASYLRMHGFEVSYYAFGNNPYQPVSDSVSTILNKISSDLHKIDMVCMYSITCNYHIAKFIATELKQKKPELIIGLGGPHANGYLKSYSCNNFSFTDHFKPFDFIGVGEGEKTVLEIAQFLDKKKPIDNIQGIAARLNGKFIHGNERKRTTTVDFPIPSYDIARIKHLPAARIFPNRGCPNSCYFCADPWKKVISYVTLDRIAEEVDILYSKYGTRYLYLGCEDFLCNENRAIEIAQIIHSTHPDILWTAQCRAKPQIKNSLLEIIIKNGCIGIEFGVESAVQSILDRVNKNITIESAKNCFKIAKALGLYTHAYWMLGLPGETRETSESTQRTMLDWAEKGLVDTWEYKQYIPYPGTIIYDNPQQFGIEILHHDYSLYHYALKPVVRTNELSPLNLHDTLQKGLELSAQLLEDFNNGDEIDIGVDLETIENMF